MVAFVTAPVTGLQCILIPDTNPKPAAQVTGTFSQTYTFVTAPATGPQSSVKVIMSADNGQGQPDGSNEAGPQVGFRPPDSTCFWVPVSPMRLKYLEMGRVKSLCERGKSTNPEGDK